jgi:outer membrane protein TolC
MVMMKSRSMPFLLTLLIQPAFAVAGGADLTSVFEAAVARSERLGQAQTAQEKAAAIRAEALGEWLPQLSLRARESFADRGNSSLQSPALSLNARQELLRGLDQPAALRAGDALEAQALAQAAKARQDLAREVGGAYLNVLALEEQLAIEREALANAEAAVAELRKRVDLGRNRRAELSSSEAQAARVAAVLAVLEARLLEARLSLASLSGLPVDQPLAPPQEAPLPTGAEAPTVQAAREALRVAQARRLGVAGGFWPTLFAEGNYHLARQDGGDGPAWDAQVGLDLDVFQFGAQRARLRQSDADLRSAQLELALAEREAQRERDQAEAGLRLARARVEASSRALEAADKGYADQQRDFRNSLVSSLDLLNAFSTLENARLEASNARWDAQRAALRLRLALGATAP